MSGEDYICAHCGFMGSPVRVNRGHIYIEIFMWFCLVVPGVIYSVWRRIRKKGVCPECLNPEMISIYSQKARRMMALANIDRVAKKTGKPKVKLKPPSVPGLKKPKQAHPAFRKKQPRLPGS